MCRKELIIGAGSAIELPRTTHETSRRPRDYYSAPIGPSPSPSPRGLPTVSHRATGGKDGSYAMFDRAVAERYSRQSVFVAGRMR